MANTAARPDSLAMNSLPLHPSVVHIPIALAVLMPLIATGLLLAWWRGWLPRRGWLVAAALQLVLVASAFVALRTGESDEERVEHVIPDEAAIEDHEEAAEVFFWTSAGVLALFVAGAAVRRENLAQAIASTAVAGTILVLAMGYRVGAAGGELVYRQGAAQAYVTTGQAAGSSAAEGDHKKKNARHDDEDDDDEDDDDD